MADTVVAFPLYGGYGGQTVPVKAVDNGGGTYSLAVSSSGTAVTSVNGATGAITLVPPDTGWTANADNGTKTAVIPASATIAAMQAALNLVVAGFGDTFVAVAEKAKALEAVLVANKRPNA